jgi:hypothetical protein
MNIDKTLSALVRTYKHYDTPSLKHYLIDLTLKNHGMDKDSEEYALLNEEIEIVREALMRRYWGKNYV